MLLLSFANAATLLNPRATRVTLLYSMEFDPSGNLLGMTIRVSVSIYMCYLHMHVCARALKINISMFHSCITVFV